MRMNLAVMEQSSLLSFAPATLDCRKEPKELIVFRTYNLSVHYVKSDDYRHQYNFYHW